MVSYNKLPVFACLDVCISLDEFCEIPVLSSDLTRTRLIISSKAGHVTSLYEKTISFLFKAILMEIFVDRLFPGQNSFEYNSQGVINLFCYSSLFSSFEQVIYLNVYEGRSGCRNILRH